MRKPHTLFRSFAAMVILMPYAQMPVSGGSPLFRTLRTQPQAEKEWGEIISLYNQAFSVYEEEGRKKKPRHRRSEQIFLSAARKLALYTDKYITDINSLTYLRAAFRLGTLWEHAGQDEQALRSYTACANHPLINNSSSQFDNKPLATLVQSRITEVSKRLNKIPDNNNQTPDARTIRRSRGGSKGGNKKKLPPHFRDLEP